jgi:DNA polymerase-3 subunit gamma/tau
MSGPGADLRRHCPRAGRPAPALGGPAGTGGRHRAGGDRCLCHPGPLRGGRWRRTAPPAVATCRRCSLRYTDEGSGKAGRMFRESKKGEGWRQATLAGRQRTSARRRQAWPTGEHRGPGSPEAGLRAAAAAAATAARGRSRMGGGARLGARRRGAWPGGGAQGRRDGRCNRRGRPGMLAHHATAPQATDHPTGGPRTAGPGAGGAGGDRRPGPLPCQHGGKQRGGGLSQALVLRVVLSGTLRLVPGASRPRGSRCQAQDGSRAEQVPAACLRLQARSGYGSTTATAARGSRRPPQAPARRSARPREQAQPLTAGSVSP